MSEESTDERRTVAAFAEQYGLTMSAVLHGIGPNYDDGNFPDPHATHWTVVLTCGGRTMPIPYHMGGAHWRWKAAPGHWMPSAGKGSMYDGAKKGGQVPYGRPRTLFDEAYLKDHAEPMPPVLTDVLNTLRLDAEGYLTAHDFEDWATNYGLDTDSRKAEEAYRACGKIASALTTLLGREALAELFETEAL